MMSSSTHAREPDVVPVIVIDVDCRMLACFPILTSSLTGNEFARNSLSHAESPGSTAMPQKTQLAYVRAMVARYVPKYALW